MVQQLDWIDTPALTNFILSAEVQFLILRLAFRTQKRADLQIDRGI